MGAGSVDPAPFLPIFIHGNQKAVVPPFTTLSMTRRSVIFD
jgi:hypothetical protein